MHMKKILVVLILLITFQIIAQEKVLRIIDGDTFELFSGEKVRIVGINAPEIKDKYGDESKKYLLSLIQNKYVILENDSISKDKDVYGRLLRYVYLDNEDINKKMIRDGFAVAYLKYSFTKNDEYERAEQLAKNENIGVWSDDESIVSETNSNTRYFIIGGGVLILLAFFIYFFRK